MEAPHVPKEPAVYHAASVLREDPESLHESLEPLHESLGQHVQSTGNNSGVLTPGLFPTAE
jgi:hypothetical protein